MPACRRAGKDSQPIALRKNVPFFEAFLKAGVQLSLFWNFSLRGNIEQSCTPTERGPYIFELIREYKQKDAAMHGE